MRNGELRVRAITRVDRGAAVELLEGRWLLSFMPTASLDFGTSAVVSADFDGDGKPDLATSYVDNTVAVALGNGDGTFREPARAVVAGDMAPVPAAAGDLNGDGHLDLVTNNYRDISVILGNGDGTFQPPRTLLTPPQAPPAGMTFLDQRPYDVFIGDFNSDGRPDLREAGVTTFFGGEPDFESRLQGYSALRAGRGDGTFAEPVVSIPPAFNPQATPGYVFGAEGDVDGDGSADLLLMSDPYVGDTALELSIRRGNGDGSFGPNEPLGIRLGDSKGPSDSANLALADFNGDGAPDIVATTAVREYAEYDEWGNGVGRSTTTRRIEVMLGNGARAFGAPVGREFDVQDDSNFSPRIITLADLNGDGASDLVLSGIDPVGTDVLINDGHWPAPPPAPPLSSLSVGDATVTESDMGTTDAVLTVTLSAASARPVTGNYATAGETATAGRDFDAVARTLTFAPGDTSKTVRVAVRGDTTDEFDETFALNLSGATGATLADARGVGTITDNDPPPAVRVGGFRRREGRVGRSLMYFVVSLSGASEKPVTVHYATSDGTAMASDRDYLARSGTITFAPGQTRRAVGVIIVGDRRRESSETFSLGLSGAANGVISVARGTGVILNDD
jgi:hypothetical protein